MISLIRLTFAAIFLGSLASANVAMAAAPTDAQKAAIRSACQSDYRKNCASVPPGGAEALQCLQNNLSKLSSACQSAVNAVSGAAAAPAPSNQTTTDTDSQSTDQSATTQSSTTQPTTQSSTQSKAPAPPPPMQLTLRQEVRLVRQSCGADVRNFCGNVPIGGGNLANCLRANFANLSGGCQNALSALAR